MAVTRERDLTGTVVVNRYRVRERIATGTTAAVYEGERIADGAAVAIKVLEAKHQDSEVAARFLREGKALGLFKHPNIVELLEIVEVDDGSLALVTELVRGVSLRTVIGVGHVDPRRALRVTRQMLEALGHAHAMGVVHRDVKPENIMLTRHGDGDLVKMLDFGVAKLVTDTAALLGEDKLTRGEFSAFGDPRYIAPECVLGRPVDARADLYSVGAVLFELLTGVPPFHDQDPSTLMRLHAYAPAPPLRQRAPGGKFTPQLEMLIAESLAKSPDVRVRSAAEMIASVDGALVSLDAAEPAQPQAAPPPGQIDDSVLRPASAYRAASDGAVDSGWTDPAPVVQRRRPSLPGVAPYVAPGESPPPAPQGPQGPQAQAATLQGFTPYVPPLPAPSPVATPIPRAPSKLAATLRRVARFARRRALYIAAGTGLVALVIVIAVLASRTSSKATPTAPAPAAAASDLARRAASLVNAGDARQAVHLIERELAVPPRPDDASAYIVLGHARLSLDRRLEALAAYETAMRLAPEVAKDPQLRANIASVLDSRDTAAAMVALELLATRVSPPALDVIAAQASNNKLPDIRHRAVAIAEREGAADKIDRVASWSLDLAQSSDCEDRRGVIARLRAAGDKRALEPLKHARATKCIAREAADAIAAFEAPR